MPKIYQNQPLDLGMNLKMDDGNIMLHQHRSKKKGHRCTAILSKPSNLVFITLKTNENKKTSIRLDQLITGKLKNLRQVVIAVAETGHLNKK